MKPGRAWTLPVLLLFALAGCSETHVTQPWPPLTPLPVVLPSPSSPQGVVELLAWCWNERDLDHYRGLFTADFQFVFALADSAGNAFRDDPFGREEMLACAQHLFVGGGGAPPAAGVVFTLDETLVPLADSRPGKDPRWHREVPSNLMLEIETTDHARYYVTGVVLFRVVRGDSAAIPPDLGLAPDSTRWYIERIEDGSVSGGTAVTGVASPQPGANTTWGRILALYLR